MRDECVNITVSLVGKSCTMLPIINFTFHVQNLQYYSLAKILCVYFFCRFCGFQRSTFPAKFLTERNMAFVVFKSFDGHYPNNSTADMGFTLNYEASEHFFFEIFFFFSLSLRKSFSNMCLVINIHFLHIFQKLPFVGNYYQLLSLEYSLL